MELSFVTYNIHKGIGTDRRYRIERIIEILRSVNADVYALQEVDQHVPRSRNHDIAALLSEELGMHYVLGLNVKLKKGAYGNAILSRFPIVDSRNINLTWGIKKRRGCLAARINVPRLGEIAVLNYHLGLAAFERMWQIKKLIESHTFSDMRQVPLVLLGDSNDRKMKLNPVLDEAGFPDTCEHNRGFNSFPSYAPLFRLDKIYASKHWQVSDHKVIRNQTTRVASDHLPVFSQLII
ncbi:MAG: endonuclease/exonuclease/phosphatase family protein [Leptospiraceae bacterium]|nr:endonuclease/exonuclease/phosphatase family protein [Leptospiraceae bacterium]